MEPFYGVVSDIAQGPPKKGKVGEGTVVGVFGYKFEAGGGFISVWIKGEKNMWKKIAAGKLIEGIHLIKFLGAK